MRKGFIFTLVFYIFFLLSKRAQALSSSGFGTYYYDVKQVTACGANFTYQNMGGVTCSSKLLSLDQINSNYVVAMNDTELRANPSFYCGKKVVVWANGNRLDLPLFIGDGCQRCATGSSSSTVWNSTGAPGLDFSYSVLELLSDKACHDGHISISWEILNETIYKFDNQPSPIELHVQSEATTKTSTKYPVAKATGIATLCADGSWKCNDNMLEQCISSSWQPRETCASGQTCRGGSNPYCISVTTPHLTRLL